MKTAYSDYFGKRCDNFSVNDLSSYSKQGSPRRSRRRIKLAFLDIAWINVHLAESKSNDVSPHRML